MTESSITTAEQLRAEVDRLVDGWCEKRSLRALRYILMAWPSTLAMTDDWQNLRKALRNVIAFAAPELDPGEADMITDAITAIDKATRRPPG